MKNRYLLGILILILVISRGCSDEDKTLSKVITDKVETTDPVVVISSSGKSTESTIITTGVDWSIEGSCEWCEVKPRSGGPGTFTIYFTALPNQDYDDRTANFTVKSGQHTLVITAHQKKKDAIIFSRDKFDNIGMDGARIDVEMETNVNYTLNLEGYEDWIVPVEPVRGMTKGLETKIASFDIKATEQGEARHGMIIFIGEDEKLRDTVTVHQVQRDMILLSPDEITVPLEGQDIIIDIRYNVDFDVIIDPAYEDWIEELPRGRAMRADKVRFRIKENDTDRDGQVIFRDKNNPATQNVLKILQREKETILFKEQSLNVPKEGGTFDLEVGDNVQGNYELVIPQYATWIKQAPTTKALASSTVTIIVEANPDEMLGRKAKLYLRGTTIDSLISEPIEIIQTGREPETNDTLTLNKIQQIMNFQHQNWPGGNQTVTYFGATFNAEGRVIGLSLPASAQGELPEVVGDLKELERLELSYHFSGKLPKSIGSLPKLRSLTISNGKFERLPEEYGGLEQLEELTINCSFSGEGFDYTEMMAVIGEMKNLNSLKINTGNYGDKMPETWKNLKKLKSLSLEGSGFKDVSQISEMISLEKLAIQNDSLSVLPDLNKLKFLNSLKITGNKSFTTLPDPFGGMTELVEMTMNGCKIQKLPEFYNLPKLEIFQLHDNEITGNIPASLTALTSLKDLRLQDNKLSGTLPENVGNLRNLTYLYLQNNMLEGNLPDGLGRLANLENLYFNDNQFSRLPQTMGGLKSLRYLYGNNNPLRGSIPEDITEATNLEYIYLQRDSILFPEKGGLEGYLPEKLGNLKKVTKIDISNNSLRGTLPNSIREMSKLNDLNLSYNELSGSVNILAQISSGTFLYFRLQHNNFNGYLPADIGELKWIVLDLSYNNLTGQIPPTLGKADFNGSNPYLGLEYNDFTGNLTQNLHNLLAKNPHFRVINQKNGVLGPYVE